MQPSALCSRNFQNSDLTGVASPSRKPSPLAPPLSPLRCCGMSSASHRQSLSAFEDDDPIVSGLQSKISNFQKKQKEKSKLKNDYFDWIRAGNDLNEAESATTKQILHACSNVLELMQKEKGHAEHCNVCDDVDPSSSRGNATASLQVDVSVLQKPARDFSCKDKDIISGISEVRRAIAGVNGQSNTEGEVRDDHALCAKLLLDLKEALATSIEESDESYSVASNEAIEHRRGAILLLSHSRNDKYQKLLPISIARALDSLHTLLHQYELVDESGEIDFLMSDLSRDFEEAHLEYNCIEAFLSHDDISKIAIPNQKKATDLERKRQAIEKDGLKEVERLRELFIARFQSNKANIERNLKRKEMTLRFKTLRLKREESLKSEAKRQVQAAAKKVGDDYQKELQHTLRVLESKRAVLKHHAEQVEVQKEYCIIKLRDDFADEVENRRRQHTNRTRSNFRQAQRDRKNVAQKIDKEEAARAEETRIERLNALAASVPYYKAVLDKSSDIHKTTEARKNDVYAGPSELADFQCGNLKSFTQEKVFSNSNFR